MYGSDSFGSVPFGASSFGAEDLFDTDAMLADTRAQFVVTVTLKVWNIAEQEEETLYLASAEWATSPHDIPSSTPFSGVLESYNFKTSINTGDRFGGIATGEGTIVFSNVDGEYDDFIDGHTVDGRRVTVRLGRKSDAFVNHLVIREAVAVDWEASEDSVTVTIKDKIERLDGPAQPDVYLGTGGAEGSEDVANKRKPIVHGGCYAVDPVLIETSLLIYQCGQAGTTATAVYDRGAILTYSGNNRADYAALAAASVSAGQYDRCSAEGLFRLGSAPAGFLFATANFTPANPFGTLQQTPTVVEWFIDNSTDLTDQDIDRGSFDALLLREGETGITFVLAPSDSKSVREVASELMLAIGGFVGFNRRGLLDVGVFTAPAGDPVASFARDKGDILDLSRDGLPSGIWPPPWRWRVAYSRIWNTFNDFAGSVPTVDVSTYSQPYKLAIADDDGIRTDHPNARDMPPVEAFYIDAPGFPGAQDEADRLLALYSAGYRLTRFTTGQRGLSPKIKIGAEINVTYPRFGLDAGKNLVIVSIEDKIEIRDGSGVPTVEIVAFG